ncbi:hypothetical protein MEM_02192 [Candida albicans L26]|uniref:CUE domain-containing protein n=1 Tax=Candida albicans P78048 TaxID=1094989 RepID=A0AB34PVL2_CANAX|nr:hypothetical protein MEO_02178 [Candida albicans P94015]KGQ95784.1 hypothetical protein MEU_02183 [Candida albicans P37005]KGR00384.1 hypothetical protein MG1_02210 [Candida albicans GC75]KGR13765.1 hypothetical protein MG3_02196 [Candida albicans P78048]KGU11087.1 hypothetical protein MEQ_02164 [Candida albicans P87]KGU15570.1 hypothetical protein MEM_02192 [Candida albicans L26]KGU28848.1 hypothetical protein MG7_02197 [Candida albicans P34048]KGU32870.1 hypothetical protein MGM_02229 [
MNDTEDTIYIPIPHYPPFKLRSSLIDKDPVIWVHLLEAYIHLMTVLLDPETPKLNVKSQQQLQLFLKIFLFETCEEETKIFSLGAINPDIKKNTSILKAYVFQLIKKYSFVKLNLTGEAIWNFTKIYAPKNISTVRGLIDGTFKSEFNDNKKSGNISSISPVQKHLDLIVTNGKFTKTEDLVILSMLLGQNTTRTSTFSMGSNKSINKKRNRSLPFAENFVNVQWIELLEKGYANGKSVNADIIKDIMIISIISLSAEKLATLTMNLGITSIAAFNVCPLFSSIIISEPYKELIPNLEKKLPFLRNIDIDDDNGYEDDDLDGYEDNIEGISILVDLWPNMTERKAKIILKQHNGDVEHVTNLLLENPELIDKIEMPKKTNNGTASTSNNTKTFTGSYKIFSGKKKGSLNNNTKLNAPSADLKKKTLESALRLMYQSDEDEPDDTYDDQEKTTGV